MHFGGKFRSIPMTAKWKPDAHRDYLESKIKNPKVLGFNGYGHVILDTSEEPEISFLIMWTYHDKFEDKVYKAYQAVLTKEREDAEKRREELENLPFEQLNKWRDEMRDTEINPTGFSEYEINREYIRRMNESRKNS